MEQLISNKLNRTQFSGFVILIALTCLVQSPSALLAFGSSFNNNAVARSKHCCNDLEVSDTIFYNLKNHNQCPTLCANPLAVVASPEQFSEIAVGAIGFHVDIGQGTPIPEPADFVEIELDSALLNPAAFIIRGSSIWPVSFTLSNLRTIHNRFEEIIIALQCELTIRFDPRFCKSPKLFLHYENNQIGPFDRLRTMAPYPLDLDPIEAPASAFAINIFMTTRSVTPESATIDITYFIHTDLGVILFEPPSDPDASFDAFNFFLQNLVNNTVLTIKAQA